MSSSNNAQAIMRKLMTFACSTFLAWYIYHMYDLSNLLLSPEKMYYLKYNELITGATPIMILFLRMLLILMLPNKEEGGLIHATGRNMWLYGFGLTLTLIAGLGLHVNPHGLFPWETFPFSNSRTYIPTAVRTQKLNLFDKLETTPNLIILGSSRAHLISSSYVYQRTGLLTFNMAVHGGLPLDFLALGQYIFSKQNPPPSVLVVEIIMPTRTGAFNIPQPLKLFPYLEYPEQIRTIHYTFLDLISLQSTSDAIYQIAYESLFPIPPPITFKRDGTGVQKPITQEMYEARLEEQSKNFTTLNLCLSKENKQQLETLTQLAFQHRTAILFYRSPLNAQYLERPDAILEQLEVCKNEFMVFMEYLKLKNSNVFFSDLSQHEPISSLRWGGYYDVQHLKPIAARLVVDAVTQEIILASNWSNKERSGAETLNEPVPVSP